MHREFCTLFDSNYLFKALAMYESLERHCASFTLTACCFDDQSREILEQLKLPNMRLLNLEQLELADPEFAATKPDRSPVEYCWTATAPLTLYVLESRPEISEVTYLDADLLFFADPELLFSEIGDDSICITPHRFSPEYERHLINGIYCVQWVTFKRDARGLEALRWWRERCIEWCYYRMEDGKLGDQKYLDDWPERFDGVCDLSHPGGGLAPWNISQYELSGAGPEIMIDGTPLVFFHYHRYSLSRSGPDRWEPPGYVITPREYELVYAPYESALESSKELVWSVAPDFAQGLEASPSLRARAGTLEEQSLDFIASKAPWAVTLRRRISKTRMIRTFSALLARLRQRPAQIRSGPARGCKFSAPASSAETYLNGEYEPQLTSALERLVKPGWVCADIGAHIGYLTIVLGHLVGSDGFVHSFEPMAENAAAIRRNVSLNRMGSRVAVHEAALAAEAGSMPIFAGRAGGGMEWTLSQDFATREDAQPSAKHAQRSITATTLEAALAGSQVDLLKMDIEGAESIVLPAIENILLNQRPLVVLEFHREIGWPGIEALLAAGYVLTELDGTPMATPDNADDVPYQLIAWPQ